MLNVIKYEDLRDIVRSAFSGAWSRRGGRPRSRRFRQLIYVDAFVLQDASLLDLNEACGRGCRSWRAVTAGCRT
jgi:hypothetical protein